MNKQSWNCKVCTYLNMEKTNFCLICNAPYFEIESNNLNINDIDLIITPSAPGEALKGLEYTGPATFNTTWSLSGNPCITVPLFKGEQNLPIGCQLITRFGYDNKLLDYAKSLLSLYLK